MPGEVIGAVVRAVVETAGELALTLATEALPPSPGRGILLMRLVILLLLVIGSGAIVAFIASQPLSWGSGLLGVIPAAANAWFVVTASRTLCVLRRRA